MSKLCQRNLGTGRMEPLGGTLNLFKSDVDEYISESDSDDLELTSGARRFDRPLFGPPRTAQEEVSQKADTPDSSLGLLDSILENQTKTLAPGSYLKIRRDGTLEERKEMKEYRKKIEDKLSNHPAFQQLRRQLYNERNASSMSMQNENPSTSLANTLGVSNGKSPKKSRWEPAQSRSSGKNNLNESSSGSPLPTTRISTLPRPALFSPQMHRNTPLLPMQPYLGALADVVNAPPPPPPPVMPQGGIGNVFLHPHQFMPQMFHGAAAIDSALLMPFGAAVNVPLTVANLSSIPMPVAPPPPPPVTTFTTIPKRTNDETLTEMDISPQTSGREHKKENGQSDDGDKVKLRGDADREMKKALTPYFKNKKITKEEYKSLMKRGVYKLIKRGKPVTTEAATKLAMNYVFELTNHR
ncbi:hypothetical protein L596_003403 [Steinernema carpocapsae]|uniref:SFR19-like C-terminal domain-containing protein n=1 Tax=Steinernema carpocapsae TaxID=34508 RepID=A0A4U8UVG1_STECR|nr:hypothetical protein L596_003403 [Steinernema carpocapsae]